MRVLRVHVRVLSVSKLCVWMCVCVQGRIQELNEGGVHNEFLMRGGVQ